MGGPSPIPSAPAVGQVVRSSWWGNSAGFKISQLFGSWENVVINGVHVNQAHTGIDIAMPTGTQLFNPVHAKVVDAGNGPGGSNLLILEMDNGERVVLNHLNTIAVHTGQDLSPGTLLGTSGMSGLATGPHLHFEVNRNGAPINPWSWLNIPGTQPSSSSSSSGQQDCSQYNVIDPRYGLCNLQNMLAPFQDTITTLTDKRNWYKVGFFVLGLTLVGVGVFVYFFKEEAHATEIAVGTAVGAAAKAP